MFGFFGELNPLSNFHPAPFMYNSTNYHSTEQLIQHQKVRRFGGKETAEEIINSKDALNCKCLSKEISNYNHDTWKKEVKSRCEERIKAKFFQNSELRDYLISTGWKKLGECCSDRLWGNGVPLHDEDCTKQSKWSQQGLLGEILVDIRSNIKDIMGINVSKSPTITDSVINLMETDTWTHL